MKKKNEFPSSRELAKWEREMKAAGLWPEKIPVYNVAKPRVKARKAGIAMNTSPITRVSTEQGFETQNIVNDIRFYRTRWM